MPHPDQLQHILKLLDDDSDVVREAIAEEMLSYGQTLDWEIETQRIPLSAEERSRINALCEEYRTKRFKARWETWQTIDDVRLRLEIPLTLISEYLSGVSADAVSKHLDALASEYLETNDTPDPKSLARFLFAQKALSLGPDNFFNPEINSLYYLLMSQHGITITLVSVFLLVGRRVGLDLKACNFPGCLLVRAKTDQEILIIDCLRGGRTLDRETLLMSAFSTAPTLADLDRFEATAENMVRRLLHNLAIVYRKKKDRVSEQFVTTLAKSIDREESEEEEAE
jgi:hypothetical protein